MAIAPRGGIKKTSEGCGKEADFGHGPRQFCRRKPRGWGLVGCGARGAA